MNKEITISENRRDEKKEVLSVLSSLAHPSSAKVILSQLDDSDIQKEASLAGIILAESLVKRNRKEAVALATKILEVNASSKINKRAEAVLKKAKK